MRKPNKEDNSSRITLANKKCKYWQKIIPVKPHVTDLAAAAY